MRRITLGRTGLNVNANGFGALPVQRVSVSEAVYLLQKALRQKCLPYRKLHRQVQTTDWQKISRMVTFFIASTGSTMISRVNLRISQKQDLHPCRLLLHSQLPAENGTGCISPIHST